MDEAVAACPDLVSRSESVFAPADPAAVMYRLSPDAF
jgi:hypothetical protein